MDYSSILQIRKELKDYTKQLPYPENDIRTSFYRYASSNISAYHEGFCLIEFLDEFNRKIDSCQIDQSSFETRDKLLYVLDNIYSKEKSIGYIGSLNRHLILDTWSIFELTVTTLLYHLYNETEITEILESNYQDFFSILSKYILSPEENKKINNLLMQNQIIKKHLTHYPITRKCDKLYTKIKLNYRRDIDKDKKFLEFYGKYRNCYHFNFMYFGKEGHYNFNGNQFDFIDSKAIICPEKPFVIDMFSELISIFKEITETLKDIKFIKPMDE